MPISAKIPAITQAGFGAAIRCTVSYSSADPAIIKFVFAPSQSQGVWDPPQEAVWEIARTLLLEGFTSRDENDIVGEGDIRFRAGYADNSLIMWLYNGESIGEILLDKNDLREFVENTRRLVPLDKELEIPADQFDAELRTLSAS